MFASLPSAIAIPYPTGEPPSMHWPNHPCDPYWDEADWLPPWYILDRWCQRDEACIQAKQQALLSACERGEVQYRRSDGKTYDDPVHELSSRGKLLIHRQSFNRQHPKPAMTPATCPSSACSTTTLKSSSACKAGLPAARRWSGFPSSAKKTSRTCRSNSWTLPITAVHARW